MTQTTPSWYSGSDIDDIHALAEQVKPMLKEKEGQQLVRLEEMKGRESQEYLDEVLRLYKKRLLGVIERTSNHPGVRGKGGRKIGSHRDGGR